MTRVCVGNARLLSSARVVKIPNRDSPGSCSFTSTSFFAHKSFRNALISDYH